MSAVMTAPVTPAVAQPSAGVWLTAWRRFKNDRVGRVAGVIVIAFQLLIAAAGLGLVASDWQRELAVPNAPPTLLGPRAGEDAGVMAGAESKVLPPVDLSDIDPLAPRYKEWAERASKMQTTETVKAQTLVLGADRLAATCWPRPSRAPRSRSSWGCWRPCWPP